MPIPELTAATEALLANPARACGLRMRALSPPPPRARTDLNRCAGAFRARTHRGLSLLAAVRSPPERQLYGSKQTRTKAVSITHVAEMAPAVQLLAALEDEAYRLYYEIKARQWAPVRP